MSQAVLFDPGPSSPTKPEPAILVLVPTVPEQPAPGQTEPPPVPVQSDMAYPDPDRAARYYLTDESGIDLSAPFRVKAAAIIVARRTVLRDVDAVVQIRDGRGMVLTVAAGRGLKSALERAEQHNRQRGSFLTVADPFTQACSEGGKHDWAVEDGATGLFRCDKCGTAGRAVSNGLKIVVVPVRGGAVEGVVELEAAE